MIYVIIGSGNGLSPVSRKSVTLANLDVLSIEPSEANIAWIWISYNIFDQDNKFEISSTKFRPICWGLVINQTFRNIL